MKKKKKENDVVREEALILHVYTDMFYITCTYLRSARCSL